MLLQPKNNPFNFTQAQTNLILGSYQVPKGYINLTDMCKREGKHFADYYRNKSTREYLALVSEDLNIPNHKLIVFVKAYGNQGTWGHFDIALDLARWVSIPFRIWSNRVLLHAFNGNFQALTPDAEEAKHKLEVLRRRIF